MLKASYLTPRSSNSYKNKFPLADKNQKRASENNTNVRDIKLYVPPSFIKPFKLGSFRDPFRGVFST